MTHLGEECPHDLILYISGIPYYMSAVLAPLLGFLIDRTGRNVIWVMFASICTLIGHGLLIIQCSQAIAYAAIIIIGVGYSTVASSLWPIIAMVTPLHQQGTSYGKNIMW